ncbi:MAG: hypothetical protein NWR50_00975, partial [Crocinitomicaceae bacterium]|nr:hypothetical protein [Crocinitomicaceae bacterium]
MNKVKICLIFCLYLFISNETTAQLSYYYENGIEATRTLVKNQKGSPNVTQMSFYGFNFVNNSVHACLTDELPFVPFEEFKVAKKGDYEVYSRKYKNKYNDEIAPERRFIQVNYTTATIEGERVVISARFEGLQDYIGEFYGAFWLPTIDAKITSSGEVMAHTFLQDNISVQTKYDKVKRDQLFWIDVTNKEIKDFSKFKTALSKKLIKEREERNAFNKKRASTVFNLKEVSSTDYLKVKKAVEESVYDALAKNTSDVNLMFNLIINVDTTGKLSVSIDGNSALNEQIIKSLNYISFDKYKEKGVFMFTKDVFAIDASKKLENGQVYLKGENVKFMSVYSKSYEEAVAANKADLDNGRGIYDISVSFIDFNGNSTATMRVNSYKEKKSAGYYLLGGAAVLGVGGYY